jgi:hypothetical protein
LGKDLIVGSGLSNPGSGDRSTVAVRVIGSARILLLAWPARARSVGKPYMAPNFQGKEPLCWLQTVTTRVSLALVLADPGPSQDQVTDFKECHTGSCNIVRLVGLGLGCLTAPARDKLHHMPRFLIV